MNIIFGINPVLEALRANAKGIERLYLVEGSLNARIAGEVLTRAREAGLRIERVDRDRLTHLAQGGVHQGVAAEARDFEYETLPGLLQKARAADQKALLVFCDGIQDPQNLGAIIRSAHAFGAQGVVVMKDRAVGVTGAVVKASAGATALCAVAQVVNLSRALEEAKEAGLWSVAADPEGSSDIWRAPLTGPLALVLGAEGAGVRKGVLSHCDFRVRIPMSGQVASLNASVSAGIMLAEIARRRAGQEPIVRSP